MWRYGEIAIYKPKKAWGHQKLGERHEQVVAAAEGTKSANALILGS